MYKENKVNLALINKKKINVFHHIDRRRKFGLYNHLNKMQKIDKI